MSYIEDGVWKTDSGDPIMDVNDGIIVNSHLISLEEEWCDGCENPVFKYGVFDMTPECLLKSIGGHLCREVAIEDASRQIESIVG